MKRIAALCLTVAMLVTLLAAPVFAASGIASEVQTYGTRNYDEANKILELVNQERAEEGLDPLVMDATLVEYAMQRAAETAVFYEHTRPDGTDCFTIMEGTWRAHYAAGENIAAGYQSGSAVMGDDDDPNSGGWMNSQGHKENILSSDFKSIGIGCFYQEDGTKYWVQYFSGAPSVDSYDRSGTVNVEDVRIVVDYDVLYPAMDELNDNNEVELYEGVTMPVTLYLLNAGWNYATPIKLTGGYTLTSTGECLTVNQKNSTVTGKTDGTCSLNISFGETTFTVNATVWPKPTIRSSIDNGEVTVTWSDPSGKAALFGKAANSKNWVWLMDSGEGNEYTDMYDPSNVWSYKLAFWVNGVGWVDLTSTLATWPLQTPVISKLQNTAKGVNITWKAVDGAAKYRVYVKNASGGWSKIGETTGTSFTYTKAVSGKDYTFTVRCITSDSQGFTSYYDTTGKSITYIAQPAVTKLANAENGVKVTWGAVDGAAKYRLYVKTPGGAWTRVGETTGTSMTYTKAVSGETYYFTVRCINADGSASTSSYDNTGKGITYIGQPSVTKVANTAGGVKVTWGAVDGAAKYRLYVKTPGGAWTRVGETTGTSMTYSGAVSGQTYYFTVRCVNAEGTASTSSYDNTGKSIVYIAQPAVTKLTNAANGVKVTWGAVGGAAKYRLYVKTPGGAWTRVGETTGTSMTYSGAVSGQTYYFTVRCVNADGTASTSSYDNTGKSIVYIGQPAVTALENTESGVKVTWGAVDGAAKYRLYVKTEGGAWTRVGETTDTTLTYTGAVSGETYYFTVRCINAEGTASTSSYDNTGKSITYLP